MSILNPSDSTDSVVNVQLVPMASGKPVPQAPLLSPSKPIVSFDEPASTEAPNPLLRRSLAALFSRPTLGNRSSGYSGDDVENRALCTERLPTHSPHSADELFAADGEASGDTGVADELLPRRRLSDVRKPIDRPPASEHFTTNWQKKCARCRRHVPQSVNAVVCSGAETCAAILCSTCFRQEHKILASVDLQSTSLPDFYCNLHLKSAVLYPATAILSQMTTSPVLHRSVSNPASSAALRRGGAAAAGQACTSLSPSPTSTELAAVPRRTARRAASASVSSNAAHGLLAAGFPSPDIAQLHSTVTNMTPARAWEWVSASTNASRTAPRRFLPGNVPSATTSATFSRRLATSACLIILQLACDRHPAAQILALHLPRVLLRRSTEVPGQVHSLATDSLPSLPPVSDNHRPTNALLAWCFRLRRAQDSGDARRVVQIILEGPDASVIAPASVAGTLDKLFPHKINGEVAGGDEPTAWATLAASHIATAPSEIVSQKDLLRWARRHRVKAPDAGGWTGQLVLDLHATDAATSSALARFCSLPAADIIDGRARDFALRTNNGTLLPREGKDPRPISAPNLLRRIRTSCDSRRCRPAANAFCEDRGQLGLSRGPAQIAYPLFARLVVSLGGTTTSADNRASFQNFTRQGILDGASTFLSSAAATKMHPESATSYARMLNDVFFDSPTLPRRTVTHFHALHEQRVSHALAQGCASSTTAEAVTIASAPPVKIGKLALRKFCHDDSQVSGMPGCPVDAFAPPPAWGGAEFNADKSIAVGPLGPSLVQLGYASAHATFSTVFGCPVGDTDAWVEDYWAAKYRAIISNLRRAFSVDAEAAILAANILGGPGGAAAHWLRSTNVPRNSAAWRTLATVDMEWVRLLLYMATSCPDSNIDKDDYISCLTDSDVACCFDRVYGTGSSSCLGHISATLSAHSRFAAGRAESWPIISRWCAEAGTNWRDFARALGADSVTLLRASCTSDHIGVAFSRVSAAAANSYKACTDAAATRVASYRSSTIGIGAQQCTHSKANAHPNLIASALRKSSQHSQLLQHRGGLAPEGMEKHAGLALALFFGLPVWGALDLPRPTHCRHCLAPAAEVPDSQSALTPRHNSSGAIRLRGAALKPPKIALRGILDDFGRHIHACSASGPLAGAQWRHNLFVRDIAAISAASGCEGRYHDTPIFDFGPKQRPADMLERAEQPSRHPEGLAIDVTIGAPEARSAPDREADKRIKFRDQLRMNTRLSFAPFGITVDGDVGPEAHARIARWARTLATRCAALHVPPGDPLTEVTSEVSRAFTRALISQLVHWKQYQLPRGRRR